MIFLGFSHNFSYLFKLFSWRVFLVFVLIATGFLFAPGASNVATYAADSTEVIELDVLVNNLSLGRPQDLMNQELKNGAKTDVTISNQPAGQMQIKSVKPLPVTTPVTQPDGSLKELADPTARFRTNMLITVSSTAEVRDDGSFIGDSKLKIGMPATMEGFNYYFRGNIIDLRLEKQGNG